MFHACSCSSSHSCSWSWICSIGSTDTLLWGGNSNLILACSNRWSWSCQVAGPGFNLSDPALICSFRIAASLHVSLLCFYGGPCTFSIMPGKCCSSCSCSSLSPAPAPLSILLVASFGASSSLLSLGFYCMFYGNFQTLDALCTSNAFNAFQVFHSRAAFHSPYPSPSVSLLVLSSPYSTHTRPPLFVCPSCMPSANLDGPNAPEQSYVHVPVTQSLLLHC